jgi:hypothetical protein
MHNITSVEELKYAIENLEADRIVEGELLKEQFYLTYDSLKPLNVLKRTLKDLTSGQYLIDNIPGAIMGLASGYLSKRVITIGSANIFRKLLGSVLQFGVTNMVAKNSDAIKSTGLSIFEHFLHKKVLKSKNDVR